MKNLTGRRRLSKSSVNGFINYGLVIAAFVVMQILIGQLVNVMKDGKPVRIASARDAIRHGIAFIHQELNLVSDLRVYENIFLGCELRRGLRLNHWGMRVQTNQILRHMKLPLSADALVGNLDASYRQVVEIARALRQHARILIMDEPTNGIDPEGMRELMALIRQLAEEDGKTILISSHQLHQIQQICDRVGIFVAGRLIACGGIGDLARQLEQENGLRYEIGARPGGEALVQALRGIKGVEEAALQEDGLVSLHTRADLGDAIVRTLLDGGFSLTHLRQSSTDLDEIYAKYFEKAGERNAQDKRGAGRPRRAR